MYSAIRAVQWNACYVIRSIGSCGFGRWTKKELSDCDGKREKSVKRYGEQKRLEKTGAGKMKKTSLNTTATSLALQLLTTLSISGKCSCVLAYLLPVLSTSTLEGPWDDTVWWEWLPVAFIPLPGRACWMAGKGGSWEFVIRICLRAGSPPVPIHEAVYSLYTKLRRNVVS
jgi:hypothetical protein